MINILVLVWWYKHNSNYLYFTVYNFIIKKGKDSWHQDAIPALAFLSGVGVTKSISSVPLFY